MINLSILETKNKKIKEAQEKVYEKIFINLCNIINTKAIDGKKYCLFRVPDFMLGEISYPFNDCIDYLDKKMNEVIKKDEHVSEIKFYEPNVYYIKWKL